MTMDRNLSQKSEAGKASSSQELGAPEQSGMGAGYSLSHDGGRRARIDPQRLTPTDIIALQRTIGNAAVQRMLAERPRPQPQAAPPAVLSKTQPTIQREIIDDESDEEGKE